jgi:hypothetical protein
MERASAHPGASACSDTQDRAPKVGRWSFCRVSHAKLHGCGRPRHVRAPRAVHGNALALIVVATSEVGRIGEGGPGGLAESFGCKGYRVTAAEELAAILKDALSQDVPTVIDCPVDYSENLKLTERLGVLVCPIQSDLAC